MIAAIDLQWTTLATIILAAGAGILVAFAGVFGFLMAITSRHDRRGVDGSSEGVGT